VLRQDILSFFLSKDLKAANSLRSNSAAFLKVFGTKKLEYPGLALMCSWHANTCANIYKEPLRTSARTWCILRLKVLLIIGK
jgi:hypothetical protein